MRPSKKRKLSSSGSSEESELDFSHLEVLTHDVDLEISLRQRLAATIKSRISWALILQNSLEHDIQTDGTTSFKDGALEALDAIEAPCNPIFSRLSDVVPLYSHETPGHLHIPSRSFPSMPQEQPRVNRIRNSAVSRPFLPNTKLLFIRDTNTSPPVVAKMACPDCSRGDFTNIQGLLNHCRLRHKKDYGSHDECMQRCAVIVSEEEIDWVLANGHELGGVSIPSLRRLFEIAVGDGLSTATEMTESKNLEQPTPGGQEITLGAHLARTLGHHKDTPALAPFLGRSPRRRCINVFDDNAFVDITGDVVRPQHAVWRMPYTHRNVARPELDHVVPPTPPDGRDVGSHSSPMVAQPSPSTRFHIVARIVVSDRSLWLSPERRTQTNREHTHRWMLSVDSPSYSLHITAFLAKMTVTCLTDPPPSTLLIPMVITGPPFSAVNTTDRPFLARLTLEWAGSQNPAMEVEHWVELDGLKAAIPVLGDEQVLDVELGRNTPLYPIRKTYRPLTWESDGNDLFAPVPSEEQHIPSYIRTLKNLLPKAPMTMKDVKGRPPINIPYKLVNSPAHFRTLIPGRRKAIEWGRARVLRDAYEEHRRSLPQVDEELLALTTGDVYCWLDDEGLFPRSSIPKPAESRENVNGGKIDPPPDVFCACCGLNFSHHLASAKTESPANGFTCDIVPKQNMRIPVLDITQLLAESPSPKPVSRLGFTRSPSRSSLSTRDFVDVSDPGLTLAIWALVRPLKLRSFKTPSIDHMYPLVRLGETPEQVTEQLAPYALMSLLTKSFIQMLVRDGLQVAKHDARAASAGHRKGASMLTPSHICRGMSLLSSQCPMARSWILTNLGLVVMEIGEEGKLLPNRDVGA